MPPSVLAPTFWIRNWNDYKLSRLRGTPREDYSYFNLFQHCSDFLFPKREERNEGGRERKKKYRELGEYEGTRKHHRGCSSGNQSVLEKFDGFLPLDDISAIVGCGWGRAFTCQRKERGKDAPRILLARVAPRFYTRNQVSPTSSETILLYRGRGERDREEIGRR